MMGAKHRATFRPTPGGPDFVSSKDSRLDASLGDGQFCAGFCVGFSIFLFFFNVVLRFSIPRDPGLPFEKVPLTF